MLLLLVVVVDTIGTDIYKFYSCFPFSCISWSRVQTLYVLHLRLLYLLLTSELFNKTGNEVDHSLNTSQ